jgi:hypothetical protein
MGDDRGSVPREWWLAFARELEAHTTLPTRSGVSTCYRWVDDPYICCPEEALRRALKLLSLCRARDHLQSQRRACAGHTAILRICRGRRRHDQEPSRHPLPRGAGEVCKRQGQRKATRAMTSSPKQQSNSGATCEARARDPHRTRRQALLMRPRVLGSAVGNLVSAFHLGALLLCRAQTEKTSVRKSCSPPDFLRLVFSCSYRWRRI